MTALTDTIARPVSAASKYDRHFRTDHLMADVRGRSVRGAAVTLTAQAVKFVLQLGSTMVLARLLTPADFGLIAMVAAFTGFVGLFKDLGLSMATVQRAEITHEQVSTLFWINVGLSILLTFIGAAMAPAVAWFYGEPQLLWITIAVSGTFIFGGLSAQHTALLRRAMRFSALAFIEIAALLSGVSIAILLAWQGASHWALVGQIALHAFVMAVLSWWFSGWYPGWLRRGVGANAMLKFGANVTGFSLTNYLSRNADHVLIGWSWGAGSLGYYSKAYGLLMLPLRQINGPLSSVAIPALSRLQHDPVRFRRAFLGLIANLALVTMPCMVLLVCGAPELIRLLLGSKWLDTTPIFAWLGLAGILQPVCSACGWLYITQDRTRELMAWGLLSSALIVMSFLVGLPWGARGVAIAYSLTDIFIKTPLLWWHVGRHGSVSSWDVIRSLRLPLVAAVVTLFLFWILRYHFALQEGIKRVLLSIAILCLVHLAFYSLLRSGRERVASAISLGFSAFLRPDGRH